MILCFASFFFIWLYVAVHLQSIFLSSVSMMNIALSIPMGLVIYKMLIPFFCLLHILVVLIILGIGADNTFLFNDTWKASGQIPAIKDNLEARVAFTFRKASVKIIATSMTNFVAFLATCFASIMPMQGFGIFATIVISLDYILLIFILPCYYVFYEKHLLKIFSWKSLAARLICCRRQRPPRRDNQQQQPTQPQEPV